MLSSSPCPSYDLYSLSTYPQIAIPLSTVLSIDRSSHLEFAETIRIRVYDAEEGYSIDEYWLSYFEDLEAALETLRGGWERWKRENPQEEAEGEGRVEQRVESSLRKDAERESSPARKSHGKTPSWSESLSSKLRLFPSSSSSSPTPTLANAPPTALSPFPVLDRLSASASTLKNDARSTSPSPSSTAPRRSLTPTSPLPPPIDSDSEIDHSYPPTTFPSSGPQPASSLWSPLQTLDVPSWLRAPTSTGRKILTGAAGLATEGVGVGVKGGKKIVEVVSRGGSSKKEEREEREKRREEMSRSVWDDEALEKAEREEREGGAEDIDEEEKEKVNEKFRKGFGLTDKEAVEGRELIRPPLSTFDAPSGALI